MFGILTSLAKAAVGVAVAPVAVAVDLVETVTDSNPCGSSKTGAVVKSIGQNVGNAINPNK